VSLFNKKSIKKELAHMLQFGGMVVMRNKILFGGLMVPNKMKCKALLITYNQSIIQSKII